MRICVLGATGRTGREVVAQAQAAGHEVTALVRDPAKLAPGLRGVQVVPGDATDPQAVDRAVAGQEGVISALGPRGAREGGLLERAVPAVVAAMQRHGARRYVAVSGAGMVVPGERRAPADRLAAVLMQVAARPLVEDKRAELQALQGSDLEWVLVRPPRLTEGPRTGDYRVGIGLALGARATISRADLADFLLRCLREETFVGQAPFIRS